MISKKNITHQFISNLFIQQNKKCALSNVIIKFGKNQKEEINRQNTASLDRIDSNKGYIEQNVQWVHKDVNRMKSNLKEDYFLILCNKISNHTNKKRKKIWLYSELNDFSKYINIKYKTNRLKTILTGGYFDPLHNGHLDLLEKSADLGDCLIVAVNSDSCCITKKGYTFISIDHRINILSSIRYVDYVIINDKEDCSEILRTVKPNIYTKGGDVVENNLNVKEKNICMSNEIEIIFEVGGKKLASSSEFIKMIRESKNG